MNVLVIGSGGREHALARYINASPGCGRLYCAPGNPGTARLGNNVNIDISQHKEVSEFAKENEISLVIIGPEQPLAEGLADSLRIDGVKVFGPDMKAAMLETSKDFAKEFMARHNIPTAAYRSFTHNEMDSALEYLKGCPYPVVLKADGLAAGKGVIICGNYGEAKEYLEKMFDGLFKEAGKRVVIEEFLEGEEASVFAISDGRDFITLAPSQDHKRALDGDKGPNTGGMGAYAPTPVVTEEILKKIENTVIRPAIDGCAEEGNPYIGCLYAGLMIKDGDAKVVEFNARFGDPETQAVLTVFDGDLLGLLYSAAEGKLDKSKLYTRAKSNACCVIMAAGGYPGSYEKGREISGAFVENEAIVFHAGTKEEDGRLLTNGGRVLGVTAIGETLGKAIDLAYQAAYRINFEGKYFRKDIGRKGLV
ncbi:MAG: phosphoribosylamine--glycine ligase [Candidatus Kapaibacterium sp.]